MTQQRGEKNEVGVMIEVQLHLTGHWDRDSNGGVNDF